MKFRLISALTVLMLLGGAFTSLATVVEVVKKDFATVAGVVVMAAGDEYIIDLDGAQGLAAGDLLAVVESGGQIVHPLSGKVLGTLDATVAVLQVSRVQSGYSYARAISGDHGKIVAGTALQRFSHLSAVFRDEVGGQEVLSAELKAALPALQWQDGSSTVADLFFVATASGLQVRDQAQQLIRAYPLPQPVAAVAAPAVTAALPGSAVNYAAPVAAPLAVPALPGNNAIHYESSTALTGYTGSALTMEFPRFNKVGQFDKTTIMADFETVDGRLLMATTDSGAIQVFAVGETLAPVASGDSFTMGQILALSWYQPLSGEVYLAVTVWADKRIYSDLLQLQGNQLVAVISGYGTLLAGFDADNDGRSEWLLSQEFDRENFYGHRINALTVRANRFEAAAAPLRLPADFRIFGAVLADVTGDGQLESIFIRTNRLYIYQGDQQIYKSSKEIGASISSVTYDINPDAQNPMITSASCDVAPVVADLDGDGVVEIIAIAAEGNILQSVGASSAIDKSWLAVFKYRNGMVMKGTLGDKLERPLQGLAVQGDRALMVATDVGGLLDSSEASYVLAVPVR